MPRGGKREGAGRLPGSSKLSYGEKMSLGGECEKRTRDIIKDNIERTLAEINKNVRAEHRVAQSIPVADRKEWLASDKYKAHQEEVRYALEVTKQFLPPEIKSQSPNPEIPRAIIEEIGDAIISIPIKRPYGYRKKIVKQIAIETGLKESQVDGSWNHYRKELKKLESED